MTFAVGSLVKARGREWVVLPGFDDDLLLLRPLGGTEDEVTGVYRPLEPVEPAAFDLPDPARIGDFDSCRLLRDAIRLGFRSSAGPFRSFAQLGVEPRPYQLVPLLMALKLDPVRLLIADDVGIGKTVEACLVARELLDRGEVRRLAVLCPPHLAEQWQAELREKFHVDAELVLPSTVTRLERGLCRRPVAVRGLPARRRLDRPHQVRPAAGRLPAGLPRAGHRRRGPHLRRHRHRGCRAAPAAPAPQGPRRRPGPPPDPGHRDPPQRQGGGVPLAPVPAQPRVRRAAGRPDRQGREADRRRLAAHFVQRRRADIRHYLDADTPFPERLEKEDTYKLSAAYKALFRRVLDYARETVADDATGTRFRQRVRWWSALALLRSLASSPAAAAATLRSRAAVADAASPEDADEIGRRTVLDLEDDEAAERIDVTPGADPGEPEATATSATSDAA